MIKLDAHKPVHFCDGLTRRDFLHAGALGMAGLGLSLTDLFALKAAGAVDPANDVNCICLFLVGAPSQLDTWDMKPEAPSEVRGPYKAIKTNVPGIQISEIFPRMAQHADKFALIRSVHYAGVAVHDAGHQVMQTGRLFQAGTESPHVGSILGYLKGPKGDIPPHVLDELRANERVDPVFAKSADTLSADQLYERRWALTLMERVLRRLRDEYSATGNGSLFDWLKQLLPDEPGAPARAQIAAKLGMTDNALRQAFRRFRHRYQVLLREEIGHTVLTASEIEDELRHLIAVLRK